MNIFIENIFKSGCSESQVWRVFCWQIFVSMAVENSQHWRMSIPAAPLLPTPGTANLYTLCVWHRRCGVSLWLQCAVVWLFMSIFISFSKFLLWIFYCNVHLLLFLKTIHLLWISSTMDVICVANISSYFFSLLIFFALSFVAWELCVVMHSNLSIFCLWLLSFILHKVRD